METLAPWSTHADFAQKLDKAASGMADEGGAFLNDDRAIGAGSRDSGSGEAGAAPAIYLQILRKAVSPTPLDCVSRRRFTRAGKAGGKVDFRFTKSHFEAARRLPRVPGQPPLIRRLSR